MEKINKIIAITLDRSYGGNGGNCKVIGVFLNNIYIDDPDKILGIFHTSGNIYSSKLYELGDNIGINDLVEIIPSDIKFETETNKNIFIYLKKVTKTGVPVIDIPSDYTSLDYLDLESISKFISAKNIISDHFTRIYLCDNTKIFGPFKIENRKVLPVIGKETNSFEYRIEELIEDDLLGYLYLLKEPHTKIKSIDCSTPAQLVEFLKARISIDRADLNLILKVNEEISSINNKHSGLDQIRLKRAEGYLRQLTLSFEQLNKLSKNEDWSEVVNKTINNHKEEFKVFVLNELQERLNSIKKDLENKKVDLANFNSLIIEKQQKLETVEKQLQIMVSKQDEIVTSIKIMANILPQVIPNINSSIIKDVPNPVEFLTHLNKTAVFTDLYEFYDELKDQFNLRVPNQGEYEEGLNLLKGHRFLIAKSSEFVLNLLAHIGDAMVFIQHAEADWLKFTTWKENGLLSIAKKASTDEKHHYYYVLQDFNIASFECYGKPILDISNKIRTTIDAVNILPPNLTMILIRTDEEIEGFGFDLNSSTFKNWRCLPDLKSITLIENSNSKALDLDKLKFNRPVHDYSTQYF